MWKIRRKFYEAIKVDNLKFEIVNKKEYKLENPQILDFLKSTLYKASIRLVNQIPRFLEIRHGK